MKLYIPTVGTVLQLTQDWHTVVECEYRNNTIFQYFRVPDFDPDLWVNDLPPQKFTIPAGSRLKVDRIYLRKGKGDFDSITFLWQGCTTEPRNRVDKFSGRVDRVSRKPVRFWVRMEYANQIEFDLV